MTNGLRASISFDSGLSVWALLVTAYKTTDSLGTDKARPAFCGLHQQKTFHFPAVR
jgi:hypothetical protein